MMNSSKTWTEEAEICFPISIGLNNGTLVTPLYITFMSTITTLLQGIFWLHTRLNSSTGGRGARRFLNFTTLLINLHSRRNLLSMKADRNELLIISLNKWVMFVYLYVPFIRQWDFAHWSWQCLQKCEIGSDACLRIRPCFSSYAIWYLWKCNFSLSIQQHLPPLDIFQGHQHWSRVPVHRKHQKLKMFLLPWPRETQSSPVAITECIIFTPFDLPMRIPSVLGLSLIVCCDSKVSQLQMVATENSNMEVLAINRFYSSNYWVIQGIQRCRLSKN